MGSGPSLLAASVEKGVCFLIALALAVGSVSELSKTHIERFAPNEVVVALTKAALDATYDWQAVDRERAKHQIKVPKNFDPDRA